MFLGIPTSRYAKTSSTPTKEINYWSYRVVLLNCKYDGSIWCNHLHISFSSMEMGYHSNFLTWVCPSVLVWFLCNFLFWLKYSHPLMGLVFFKQGSKDVIILEKFVQFIY
ncbi:hypothetical protein Pint_29102 [Pistacia integerrima]|uniref:Uncharacterized protein n=1 Tax=Pistacia integerrima TaxID=434235 RepID=A0ACC0WX35_9ROSI|nr:hypothetical protein Pint_29102 [Pistacia integerrima]